MPWDRKGFDLSLMLLNSCFKVLRGLKIVRLIQGAQNLVMSFIHTYGPYNPFIWNYGCLGIYALSMGPKVMFHALK